MNSRTLFAVAAILLLVLIPPAWARKWSDRSGNSMVAKFVRVHDGKIVFLRAGKVVTVPFVDLVEEDQQFLRDDLEKKGQAHLLPAAQPDRFPASDGGESGESGSEDGPQLPIVQRVWTDVDDRKITAGLVRTDGNSVILLMNDEEVTVPLTRLSRPDQSYVRQWTMAEKMAKAAANRGNASSGAFGAGGVPGASGRPPWAPGGSGSGAGMPGSMPGMPGSMPGSMPGMPGAGSYGGPSGDSGSRGSGSRSMVSGDDGSDGATPYESSYGSESGYDVAEDESSENEETQYSSNYGEQSDSGSGNYGSEPESYASNMPGAHNRGSSAPYSSGPPSSHFSPPSSSPHSSGPPASMPPTSYAPPASQMPSMPGSPYEEEVGVCSNCNEEVSDEFGAGDHCPHCGVFFEYEEDEHGNKTEASGGSGGSDVRVSGRSIRGIVKLVIFGFVGIASLIGWVCRKMFSE